MKIKTTLTSLLLALLVVSCSIPPVFTRKPTPTPTITSTPIPSQTPTLIPSPTPTLTPTPPPAVRIENADRSILLGDYDKALQEYQSALNSASDPESQAAAMLGAGRVYYQTGQHQQALDTLRMLIDQYPASQATARGYFFLGEVYSALQRYPEAAAAYDQYLKLQPGVLDAYVQELRGDALSASQDYAGAISAYQSALQAPRLGSGDWLAAKIGQTYALNSDLPAAIAQYETVLAKSSDDSVKAQAGLLEGQAYLAQDQAADAYLSWTQIVAHYPRSYDAYSALVALVNAGEPVSDLDRGLVDYFAGQYSLAAESFNRFLASDLAVDGTALHYKALSLQAVGEQKYPAGSGLRTQANSQGGVPEDLEAIAAWQQLINTYPNDRFWSDAWDNIAVTQWAYLDQTSQAAQTMLDFVKNNPAHARAAEFLFTAGRYLERGNLLDEAAQMWERLGSEYPSAPETFRGVFFAGVTRFRQSQMDSAQSDFHNALQLALNPEDQAAAELWIGKMNKAAGDLAGAQTAWQSAAARDPTGYYSERARELFQDRAPLAAVDNIDLAMNLPEERKQAMAWVLVTFNLPSDTRLDGLDKLADDPRLIRGREFWALGLYPEARNEFEDLRTAVASDPANTFRLIQLFYDLGLYRAAIPASRQVLTLAGMDAAATLNAPIYFNHVRFGTYYKDQVLPLAKEAGFNPLLIFSLMFQESQFEGFIQSVTGARGLMQLMPATAQELVNQSGWPSNYSAQDLYRPVVNLKLGIDYLTRQRQYFDGDLYVTLAGYNGGPGYASAWKELSGNDPDLFLETVRIQETRDYIMHIVEVFSIYERLYVRNP